MNVKPPFFVMTIIWLIYNIVKAAVAVLAVCMTCFFAIAGAETLATGKNTLEAGLFSAPGYYYVASAYLAVSIIGILGILKEALTRGLFSFVEHYAGENDTGDKQSKGGQ